MFALHEIEEHLIRKKTEQWRQYSEILLNEEYA